jgi:acetolactate decarboxylase
MSLDNIFIQAFQAHREAGDLLHKDVHPDHAHAHEIFQTSTINALLEGVYDGQTSFGDMTKHGDFGLGTANGLDGEITILNGEVFQIKSDGKAYPVDPALQTPFAVVMFFCPSLHVDIDEHLDFENFTAALDAAVPSKNVFYAVKAEGKFRTIRVRSVPKQEPPYKPLTEVVENQPVYEHVDVEGTLVGFRFPDYSQGINVPGYHLHFLTKDRTAGGHVLGFHTHHAHVEIDITSDFHMELPDPGDFMGADLSRDSTDDIKKVEK